MNKVITLATLSLSGKIPNWKDWFTRRARSGEIEVPMTFSNFIGILLGPTDLDGFKLFIRSLTSMKVTGLRKIELEILFDK